MTEGNVSRELRPIAAECSQLMLRYESSPFQSNFRIFRLAESSECRGSNPECFREKICKQNIPMFSNKCLFFFVYFVHFCGYNPFLISTTEPSSRFSTPSITKFSSIFIPPVMITFSPTFSPRVTFLRSALFSLIITNAK